MNLGTDGLAKALPYLAKFDEAPAFWLVDILWVVLASGEQTEGRYSVLWQLMPESSGPPPHVHAYEDEWFFVIDGEMTIEVGGETIVAKSGSFAVIPRNTVHSFKVTSPSCTVLDYFSPAGFEQAIMNCGRPAGSRSLPPRGLDPPDSPQVFRFFNNYWIAPADLPWAIQPRGRD